MHIQCSYLAYLITRCLSGYAQAWLSSGDPRRLTSAFNVGRWHECRISLLALTALVCDTHAQLFRLRKRLHLFSDSAHELRMWLWIAVQRASGGVVILMASSRRVNDCPHTLLVSPHWHCYRCNVPSFIIIGRFILALLLKVATKIILILWLPFYNIRVLFLLCKADNFTFIAGIYSWNEMRLLPICTKRS